MTDRYLHLYKNTQSTYADGAPVVIEACALLLDTVEIKYIAQAKFRSLSTNLIREMHVRFHLYNEEGKQIMAWKHTYPDLAVENGQFFGQQEPVELPNTSSRVMTVTVEQVVFADGTIWESQGAEWKQISAVPPAEAPAAEPAVTSTEIPTAAPYAPPVNQAPPLMSGSGIVKPRKKPLIAMNRTTGLIAGLLLVVVIAAIAVSGHHKKSTSTDDYDYSYDDDSYDSSSSGGYTDDQLELKAAVAVLAEIRDKQSSYQTVPWSSSINPGNCKYDVSLIEPDGYDGYRVCGNGYLYDDYGNLTEKYRDGSGGWTFTFEVKVSSTGSTTCTLN